MISHAAQRHGAGLHLRDLSRTTIYKYISLLEA